MLSNKDIYFSIETNLQTVHGFTYRRVEQDEYDEAINSVLVKELSRIKDSPSRSSIEKKILSEATVNELYEFNTSAKEKSVRVGYNEVNSSSSHIINTKCTRTAIIVREGEYYYSPYKIKYQDKWVDYFVGKNDPTFFSKQLYTTQVKEIKNIDVDAMNYAYYKTQKLFKPICTIENGVLKIYSEKYEIVQLAVNRTKTIEELKIDNCKDKTLNFSEASQRYFIDLAVERLAIRLNQDSQKINNLISETK